MAAVAIGILLVLAAIPIALSFRHLRGWGAPEESSTEYGSARPVPKSVWGWVLVCTLCHVMGAVALAGTLHGVGPLAWILMVGIGVLSVGLSAWVIWVIANGRVPWLTIATVFTLMAVPLGVDALVAWVLWPNRTADGLGGLTTSAEFAALPALSSSVGLMCFSLGGGISLVVLKARRGGQ